MQKTLKIGMAWVVPVFFFVIACYAWVTQSDTSLKLWSLPLGLGALALYYSVAILRAQPTRRLATVKHRIYPTDLRKKTVRSSLACLSVALIVVFANRDGTLSGTALGLVVPSAIFAVYLFLLFQPQYTEVFTPAAKEEYARLQHAKSAGLLPASAAETFMKRAINIAQGLWTIWLVRYGVGALFLTFAFKIATGYGTDSWILAVGPALVGLAFMKELAAWVIGIVVVGGILYTIVGVLAAVPIGLAIIIGATIIASSRKD